MHFSPLTGVSVYRMPLLQKLPSHFPSTLFCTLLLPFQHLFLYLYIFLLSYHVILYLFFFLITLTGLVSLMVIALFFITSADSGIYVLNNIASRDKSLIAPRWQAVMWGLLMSAAAIVLLRILCCYILFSWILKTSTAARPP